MAAALVECAYHIWGGARCGYAYHGILVVDVVFLKVAPALFHVVFSVLDGVAQGGVAAGYEAYHPRRIHAECGRNLGSVEHAQAPRCAGAHVENAAAALHAGHDFGDEFFNLRQGFLYGQRHFLVFVVDVAEYLADGFLLKVVVERRLLTYLDKCHIKR